MVIQKKTSLLMPCTAGSHTDVTVDFLTSEDVMLNTQTSLRLSMKIQQKNAKQGNLSTYSILFG